MALFNDGPISSIEDLTGQDTQLLEVARVEGIDVTQKLLQAQVELSLELSTMLQSLSGVHGGLSRQNSGPDIGSVVVTPELKLWHTFRSLEMVYRDAYNSQLNDRYAGKRDQYREQTKWAYEKGPADRHQGGQRPNSASSHARSIHVSGSTPGRVLLCGHGMDKRCGRGRHALRTSGSWVSGAPFGSTGDAPRSARGWNVYVGAARKSCCFKTSRH
jgi:hypothetical protein